MTGRAFRATRHPASSRSTSLLPALLVALLLVLPTGTSAQYEEPPAPAAYALTDVTLVHPDGRRESGVDVVVRGRLIEAIGAGVEIPPDARVLEGDSLWVHPGMVDAWGEASLDLPPVDRSEEMPWAPSREAQGFTPDRTLRDVLSATGAATRAQRRAGVVAAGIVPGSGLAPGELGVVVFRPDAELPRQMIAHTSLGPVLTFESARGVYPGTLFGVIARLRQAFEDALHQERVRTAYAADPRGIPTPSWDPGLETLRRAAEGEVPVFFVADEDEDIRRALSLSDEYGFRMVLVGGMEAWEVSGELRGRDVPVLVSLDFPEPEEWRPDDEEDPLEEAEPLDPEQPGRREPPGEPEPPDEPAERAPAETLDPGPEQEPLSPGALRERERLEDLYANAGRLAEAGVRIALTSGGGEADLREGARRAVEYGLSEEEAVRALTVTPAEILGIPSTARVEERMPATFVVTDGPLLSADAEVRYTFVEGILERGREAGEAIGDEPPEVDLTGTWTLDLEGMRGETGRIEIEQQGATFTGTASIGDERSRIEEGVVSGNQVTFRVRPRGADFTLEGRGAVEGDTMRGTVTAPDGEEQEFTATRVSPPPREGARRATRAPYAGGGR